MTETGTLLCRLGDLAATGARGVTLGEWPKARNIVVVQDGEHVRAFENRCPHLMATLETVPDRFLDAAREYLVCSTHGAQFRIGDGFCVSGPCRGEALPTVAIQVLGDEIRMIPANPGANPA